MEIAIFYALTKYKVMIMDIECVDILTGENLSTIKVANMGLLY